MTDYRLLIWEINLTTNRACIMYDFFYLRLNGKEYAYDKMSRIFVESYIEEKERKDILHKMSLEELQKLDGEERFETHIYLENGENRSVRLILTPAPNEQGNREIVYFSVIDLEDDLDGMAEIVNRRKKTLLSRLRLAAGLPISHIIVAIVFLVFLILTSFGIGGIRQELYKEQSSNLKRVTEKVGQTVDMLMDQKWKDVHYVAAQVCADRFSTRADFLAELERISTYFEMENNAIMAIDSQGLCYHFNGESFEWIDMELLNSGEEKALVAVFSNIGLEKEQMLFTMPLPYAIEVEEQSFTHIVLACDMNMLDEFIQMRDYGSDSVTYITHMNQNVIYKVPDTHTGDILAELKECKYQRKTNLEMFQKDVQNHNLGCVFVTYKSIPSYVAYQKLANDDWYVIMMVPAQYVGNSTTEFMEYTMIAIALMALGILCIILSLVYVDIAKSKKELRHVNDALRKATQIIRNAAEAQKSANEAKTRFLSTMSHDIRTPMNVISGMTELATMRIGDMNYVQECLGKIKIASNHLLTLINDVLDISKVESGNVELNINRFSISELIGNLENIMKPEALAKSQQISIKLCYEEIDYLLGDELRINQIFINLLSNAIKYTPENGNIRVDVIAEETEESTVKLTYIVEDNGIGMSEAFQKKMYDVFAREMDSRVNKIEGTGLGLAICKQMIDLMGGTINCESKEGIGTKITVKLFLEKADVSDLVEYQSEEKKEDSLCGMKVLVAEDNELNWEILESIFEIYDIKAYRVENGKQCIEHLEKTDINNYELILMDVQMPILNGKEATKLIRKSEKEWIRNIPIVAMTADAFAEDVEECLNAGMNGHIAKPIDMNKMFLELRKYKKTDNSR